MSTSLSASQSIYEASLNEALGVGDQSLLSVLDEREPIQEQGEESDHVSNEEQEEENNRVSSEEQEEEHSHISNETLLPPEETFLTFDKAFEEVQSWALNHGYTLAIGKSVKNSYSIFRRRLDCSRGRL